MWLLQMKEAYEPGRRRQHESAEGAPPTDEAENVSDGRHKDDEQVDQEDERKGDDDVSGPLERFVREQYLLHGPADLHGVRP